MSCNIYSKCRSSEKKESHDQTSETSVSSDADHTYTSTMSEDKEEEHENDIIETSLSSGRHGAQTDNEDVEIKTKVKQKRRSFVLSIIPGRRDSVSLQFIKIPRVIMKKNKNKKRQNTHLTLQDREDIEEESLINQDDDDEERLIDQDNDQERLIDQDNDQERLIDQDNDQERLIDQDNDQERLIDQDDDQERFIDQDNDQERLIDQDDDQERLIDQDELKTTKCTKAWFVKKLISFRIGLKKAFKNLKFFFK